MVQQWTVFAVSSDDLSLVTGTHVEKKITIPDLHTHARRHTQAPKYRIEQQNKNLKDFIE